MVKLLLIDDEKGMTASLKDFFVHRKFYVKTANSGEDALELLKNDDFNIVFLDVTMKGMNGLDTLERIKKMNRKIKVIMLTVHHEKETMEKAKALGADEYITKPFQLDHLEDVALEKVRELMRENT